MPEGEIGTWIGLLDAVGVAGLFLFLFLKGKIHSDREFQNEREDKIYYRNALNRMLGVGEDIAEAARRTIDGKDRDSELIAQRVAEELARREKR